MTARQPIRLRRANGRIGRFALVITFLVALSAVAALDFAPVDRLLEKTVSEGEVAGGSVLVLHRGNVVFEKGFGFADLESREPFKVETPVIVASISKPLLGTAAFRLSEKGAVDLTTPISKYIPEFKSATLKSGEALKRAPTTIELFTHTAGTRYSEAPGGRPWFASWTRGRPLAYVVKRYALEIPFAAQPGTRYAYSGIGTDIAARVLEVAAGQPRNQLLAAEVAKPLGMTRTFYRDAVNLKLVGRMPTRYHRGKDGRLVADKGRPIPPKNTYSSSGGSVISIAPDLAKWLLMISNQGRHEGHAFLAPETLAEMLTAAPHSRNARGGLFIRKKDDAGKTIVVGHTGSSGANCWIDFEHDLIGIMLTQTRGKDIRSFRITLEKLITECVANPTQHGALR